jgi:hypothetical protein
MATTTTNFGWDIPQSTDLVKDGATAIAALGQDIDTALVDLKGGTTGQVLSKASNTDLDFTWVTDAGDISGVTAGTGISGGGTSGDVTVTNSMATAIDAKGDLIAGTGADAFARLAVGTNGQVLTADSTAATGLAWATAGGSSGPAFWVRRASTSQSMSSGVLTKMQFNSEEFDTDSCYDPTTNYRFTANKSGYYSFNTNILMDGGSMTAGEVGFRKNGTTWAFGTFGAPASGYLGVSCNTIIYLNGTTDYVEVWGTNYGGGNLNAAVSCFFSGVWIRS